jgi:hypothetical protein
LFLVQLYWVSSVNQVPWLDSSGLC